jgi:Flp pilus assembly protein TadG
MRCGQRRSRRIVKFTLPSEKAPNSGWDFEVSGSTCLNDRDATTPTCFRSVNALWRDTEGSVLLEATVLTPVLLVLFLGAYEFSWYFNRQQMVEVGVRDAARYLGAASANPCSVGTLLTQAKNLATTGIVTSGGTARVLGWSASDVSISCATIDNTAGTYYCPTTTPNCYSVTVRSSFPDPSILGSFSFLGLSTPNLSFSHTERANQGSSP